MSERIFINNLKNYILFLLVLANLIPPEWGIKVK